MHDRYDYEPREHPGWSDFSDTDPAAEPVFDYSIWPPEPPEPEAARDQSRRRLARLAWRATLLSAVGAAAFAILFVRSAPAHTTGQNVVSPPAPAAATPASSPRHQHPRASAALRPGHRAAAPKPAAQASPTLAPPPANPAPEPEDSGGHSGRGGPGR